MTMKMVFIGVCRFKSGNSQIHHQCLQVHHNRRLEYILDHRAILTGKIPRQFMIIIMSFLI